MGQMNENMELEQMREQLALLREKLKQQEIVNENAVVKAIKMGVGSINRRGVVQVLIGMFSVPFCCYVFAGMGLTDDFVMGTGIMLTVCLCATVYAHFGLNLLSISRDNLIQVGLRTLRLRKIYKIWYYFAIPMLLVWGYFLYCELAMLITDAEQFKAMLLGLLLGGVIGGAIGVRMHFKTLREADDVLEHIRELKDMQE